MTRTLAATFGCLIIIVAIFGFVNGIRWARSSNEEQLLQAAVTVDIDHIPGNQVSVLLLELKTPASQLRVDAHTLAAHGLSLYSDPQAVARYRSIAAAFTREGAFRYRPPPPTEVEFPATGAVLSGKTLLVASAGKGLYPVKVDFVLSRGAVRQGIHYDEARDFGMDGSLEHIECAQWFILLTKYRRCQIRRVHKSSDCRHREELARLTHSSRHLGHHTHRSAERAARIERSCWFGCPRCESRHSLQSQRADPAKSDWRLSPDTLKRHQIRCSDRHLWTSRKREYDSRDHRGRYPHALRPNPTARCRRLQSPGPRLPTQYGRRRSPRAFLRRRRPPRSRSRRVSRRCSRPSQVRARPF